MSTIEAIQAKIKKLQAQADVIVNKSKTVAIKKIHALMLENDLTIEEVGNPSGKKAASPKGKAVKTAGGTVAPKYADPKTGATWSGRGRMPLWMQGAKNPAKFLIASTTVAESAAEPTVKAKAKASTKKRAGAAPKYRDPATGTTWTGRGTAPHWIRDKDRTQFLIQS